MSELITIIVSLSNFNKISKMLKLTSKELMMLLKTYLSLEEVNLEPELLPFKKTKPLTEKLLLKLTLLDHNNTNPLKLNLLNTPQLLMPLMKLLPFFPHSLTHH